jgi:hypothetical protein
LADVDVALADLPGDLLGEAAASVVRIDRDAAGHGWFVDPTPAADEEFLQDDDGGARSALPGGPAVVGIDLLTAVMHEFGHVLGAGHSTGDDVMEDRLSSGARKLLFALLAD